MNNLDIYWMRQAYELAIKARDAGEVPVGAVLVDAEGVLIGSGYNRVIQSQDPTAHAEIIAVRNAALAKNNYRLPNTTLHVTLEPCPMCAGALVHSRVERLVFATEDPKTGAAGSVCNLLNGFPFNHRVIQEKGIMQENCSELLKTFFRERRLQSGSSPANHY